MATFEVEEIVADRYKKLAQDAWDKCGIHGAADVVVTGFGVRINGVYVTPDELEALASIPFKGDQRVDAQPTTKKLAAKMVYGEAKMLNSCIARCERLGLRVSVVTDSMFKTYVDRPAVSVKVYEQLDYADTTPEE